jgi:phosphoglycolate phosphatase
MAPTTELARNAASVVTRLIVFDLDGTLVDSSRDITAAVNAALRRLAPGAAAIPLERILGFVGEGARLLIERSLEHAAVALPVDEVLAVYLDCYRERLLETTRLYPGVAEALDALAPAGPELAVLTNKPGDMSRAILEGLGVAARFGRILGAGDVPARKPDPTGLVALLAELAIAAGQAWLVGDSATDVLTARAAGVRVAGVTWGFHPAELRAAGPDRILDHPGEWLGLAAE